LAAGVWVCARACLFLVFHDFHDWHDWRAAPAVWRRFCPFLPVAYWVST
jgi:hypothetical protein